jgi:hypothetical protein
VAFVAYVCARTAQRVYALGNARVRVCVVPYVCVCAGVCVCARVCACVRMMRVMRVRAVHARERKCPHWIVLAMYCASRCPSMFACVDCDGKANTLAARDLREHSLRVLAMPCRCVGESAPHVGGIEAKVTRPAPAAESGIKGRRPLLRTKQACKAVSATCSVG